MPFEMENDNSIIRLDKWCKLHNKSIVVRKGKLCGFNSFDYEVGQE